ncbi:hypothetical protein IMZ48_13850 [Candidatus Bathyarchaeota archaeon]|nr:hypothetical protein [Candidatus Bathyarchaeota archaeon]
MYKQQPSQHIAHNPPDLPRGQRSPGIKYLQERQRLKRQDEDVLAFAIAKGLQ